MAQYEARRQTKPATKTLVKVGSKEYYINSTIGVKTTLILCKAYFKSNCFVFCNRGILDFEWHFGKSEWWDAKF